MHSNHISIHHSAMRHRVLSHQIAAQLFSHQRAQWVILQTLRDRKIIDLADSFRAALGFTTSTTTVFLSAERHRHILARRRASSEIDADIAANRITEALSDVRLKRKVRCHPDLWEVIGFVHSAQMHLKVVIKLVPAARSTKSVDELWIQTAHPVGTKRLREFLAANHFITI